MKIYNVKINRDPKLEDIEALIKKVKKKILVN